MKFKYLKEAVFDLDIDTWADIDDSENLESENDELQMSRDNFNKQILSSFKNKKIEKWLNCIFSERTQQELCSRFDTKRYFSISSDGLLYIYTKTRYTDTFPVFLDASDINKIPESGNLHKFIKFLFSRMLDIYYDESTDNTIVYDYYFDIDNNKSVDKDAPIVQCLRRFPKGPMPSLEYSNMKYCINCMTILLNNIVNFFSNFMNIANKRFMSNIAIVLLEVLVRAGCLNAPEATDIYNKINWDESRVVFHFNIMNNISFCDYNSYHIFIKDLKQYYDMFSDDSKLKKYFDFSNLKNNVIGDKIFFRFENSNLLYTSSFHFPEDLLYLDRNISENQWDTIITDMREFIYHYMKCVSLFTGTEEYEDIPKQVIQELSSLSEFPEYYRNQESFENKIQKITDKYQNEFEKQFKNIKFKFEFA